MCFEKGVHEKTRFFEKGEIVLTLAGCSRMRVGEGLHKKIKSKNEKNIKKTTQKRARKRDGTNMKKPSKSDPKRR